MINILMATYNGARYLPEQIDSLLRQTEQDFTLYVHDDCSNDGTWALLCEYAGRYPGKISICQNEQNSGGAEHNFLQMMAAHRNGYVMLCDQDDVWLPDKIERTLKAMRAAEAAYGEATPILVHTDLYVADQDLSVVSNSLNDMLALEMDRTSLASQIVQNTVTGCTAMYNTALAQRIRTPQYCIMHDWWLGLITVCFGRRVYLPEPTVLYRQHGGNSVGAKKVRSLQYVLRKLFHPQQTFLVREQTYRQTADFLRAYEDALSPAQADLLRDYIRIPSLPRAKRWIELKRLGVLRHSKLRRLGQFFTV